MTTQKRIAINFGGGLCPGLNSVITGAVLTASELGWEAVASVMDLRDCSSPTATRWRLERLTPEIVENIGGATGCILGTAARATPSRPHRQR